MNAPRLFIAGEWRSGRGAAFERRDPARDRLLWQGASAAAADVDAAFAAAQAARENWADRPFAEREAIARRFAALLEQNKENLARVIAEETGKPLWEARTEVAAMIGKIAISVTAYHQRTGTQESQTGAITSQLTHRPHGVVAVYGPYNFPGHLPNGHIVPALLAGNCVLFKPSELTPWTAEETVKLWQQAGIPPGVLQLLQGERATGEALAAHPQLEGLYFTGSSRTGHLLNRQFADRPGTILALEMGGNNPLVIGPVSDERALVHDIVQSAYLTSGQRCTCARRLMVPAGAAGDRVLEALSAALAGIRIAAWDAEPAPFMGPLVSAAAARQLLTAQERLLALGARPLRALAAHADGAAFLSPGVLDVSAVGELPDEEYFGPLLQVLRYRDFDQALVLANRTRYGLSAGLLSDDAAQWAHFRRRIRAGIVNWNRPTTGASSAAPFGGVGGSGNHRASAFYAADYCAYPMASMMTPRCELPATLSPGLTL